MRVHFGCGVQRNAGSRIWTAEIAAAAAEDSGFEYLISGFEYLISLLILNLFFSLEAFLRFDRTELLLFTGEQLGL